MKKRMLSSLLILSLLLLLTVVPVFASSNTQLILSVPQHTVLLGTDMQITVYNQEFDTVTEGLTWKSSAPEVLSVDDSGKVTAHTVGGATVTATDSSGISGSAYLLAAEFSLSSPTNTPYVGQTLQISVTALPGWVENNPLAWSSSDERVATVDQNGLVTCHARGSVYINAFAPNGNAQAVILTVGSRIDFLSSGLSFPLVIPLNNFKTVLIRATDYEPDDLTVTADDPDVVSVSLSPVSNFFQLLIRAKAHGSTTVTVQGSEGDSLSFEVAVPSLTVSRDGSPYLPLFIGKGVQFDAKDHTGTPVEVTWSSEDPLIASVDEDGLVTGLNYGTTSIIATDSLGLQARSTVNVLPFEVTDRSGCNELQVGKTTLLGMNVAPGWEDRIRFSSSDPTVAQVNEQGEITGLKAGTALIEISTDISERPDIMCLVTVVDPFCAGTLNGSLQWRYDLKSGTLTLTGEIPDGYTVYTALYDRNGRMLEVIPLTAGGTARFEPGAQPDTIRLFLTDGGHSALCSMSEQTL